MKRMGAVLACVVTIASGFAVAQDNTDKGLYQVLKTEKVGGEGVRPRGLDGLVFERNQLG